MSSHRRQLPEEEGSEWNSEDEHQYRLYQEDLADREAWIEAMEAAAEAAERAEAERLREEESLRREARRNRKRRGKWYRRALRRMLTPRPLKATCLAALPEDLARIYNEEKGEHKRRKRARQIRRRI